MTLTDFREIWLVDFEFRAPPGERSEPVCLVAAEYRSGRTLRLWKHELGAYPPYACDEDSLFVAYYASAELGCHLALNWPPAANVLDLYAEFRTLTNGRVVPCGSGLVGALAWFGLDSMDAQEKDSMRELIMTRESWTEAEQHAILDYCESDVIALRKLLPKLEHHLDLPRALLRGRYMKAAARIEYAGVPIDIVTWRRMLIHWEQIKEVLIERVDSQYHVYENGAFRQSRWACWLMQQNVPWPKLPSGKLDLKDETFKGMARRYPQVAPTSLS